MTCLPPQTREDTTHANEIACCSFARAKRIAITRGMYQRFGKRKSGKISGLSKKIQRRVAVNREEERGDGGKPAPALMAFAEPAPAPAFVLPS